MRNKVIKIASILVVILIMLTGCNKRVESSGDSVVFTTSESMSSDKTEDTKSETTVSSGEEEEATPFDYFVYAYSMVSQVLVLGDATYLVEGYTEAETETGKEYTFTQEKDKTGVIEINYMFNDDGTRSACVVFDVTDDVIQQIIDKMEELLKDDETAFFEKTATGFKCTDVLSVMNGDKMGVTKRPSLQSTIEVAVINNYMYLLFNPVLETVVDF